MAVLGGVAAWPLAARALEATAPSIGVLSSRSQADSTDVVAAFRKGLAELGYAEGQNVSLEYHWTDGQYDRLPSMASELVRRQVAVIFATGGIVSALAAKAATSTIPIVFTVGDDPVKHGLVASLSRPGGNATGVLIIVADLGSKRLELLHELIPTARLIAVLVNPSNPNLNTQLEGFRSAARSLHLQLQVLNVSNDAEVHAAFASLLRTGIEALLVGADPFIYSRRDQIIALAAEHGMPTIYEGREFAEAGGLVSYGPNRTEAARLAGIYAGRILRGARPDDLPVQAPTRFELVINLKTAKALGLTIPPSLLARADEVIE
jgi:putative ABC transport system substrate-binding protein